MRVGGRGRAVRRENDGKWKCRNTEKKQIKNEETQAKLILMIHYPNLIDVEVLTNIFYIRKCLYQVRNMTVVIPSFDVLQHFILPFDLGLSVIFLGVRYFCDLFVWRI